MEERTDSQYDIDLTVGTDEYYDSLQTDEVDLFEFTSDEESQISKLKTIILSIDWEITDEILRECNEELLVLKDIWADDKIKLVYVQALEKLSKYIYQEKSNAHHNAIKLLLAFFYNLEKIVSTESLSDVEAKKILQKDIQRFDHLKKQISAKYASDGQGQQAVAEPSPVQAAAPAAPAVLPAADDKDSPVLKLKAIILGMDWEITDNDLVELAGEVKVLEKRFRNSKTKLIFLQGIGALGAYIKHKKSNAHADAFKLLHSFFTGLETLATQNMSVAEEKKILLPEVEKFDNFKKLISTTISPEAIAAGPAPQDELPEAPVAEDGVVAPAFSEYPADVHGFQEEEEVVALGGKAEIDVDSYIDNFFSEDDEPSVAPAYEEGPVADVFLGDEEESLSSVVSAEVALQGVDVETDADDDSDEAALFVQDGEVAPALTATDDTVAGSAFSESADFGTDEIEGRLANFFAEEDETVADVAEEPPALLHDEQDEQELVVAAENAALTEEPNLDESELAYDEIEERLADFFVEEEQEMPAFDGQPAALSGVDVETDADDDSTERSLPRVDGEIAPALADVDATALQDDFDAEPGAAATAVAPAEPIGEDDSASLELPLEQELSEFFALEDDDALDVADPDETEREQAVETVVDTDVPEMLEPAETPESLEVSEDAEPVEETAVADVSETAEMVSDEDEELPLDFSDVDMLNEFEEDETALVLEDEIAAHEPDITVAEPVMPTDADELPATGQADGRGEMFKYAPDGSLNFEDWSSFRGGPAVAQPEVTPEAQEDSEPASLFGGEQEPALASEPVIEEETEAADTEIAGAVDQASVEDEEEGFLFTLADEEGDDLQDADVLPATDVMPAADSAALFTADSEEDDEIVFLPVEDEDDYSALSDIPEGIVVEDDVEEPLVSEPVTFESAEEEPAADVEPEVTEAAGDGEFQMELLSDDAEGLDGEAGVTDEPAATDMLETLRAAAASLQDDAEGDALRTLSAEINTLRWQWVESPMNKTFLQLLATVVQHIEKCGADADSRAYTLLHSLVDTLDTVAAGSAEPGQIQESLLSETSKVLRWQQELAGHTDTQLTAQADESAAPAIAESEQQETTAESEQISQLIRRELQGVQESLRQEIEELRSELKEYRQK